MVATVQNFFGAEDQGVIEALSVAGSFAAQSSVVDTAMGGGWAYESPDGSSKAVFVSGTTSLSNNFVICLRIRLSSTSPSTNPLLIARGRNLNDSSLFSVILDTDGSVKVWNANESSVLTISTPGISSNTWHTWEIYGTGHATTGFVEVFIDGVSKGSISSIDTSPPVGGTELARIEVFGNAPGTGNPTSISAYLDNSYFMDGLSSTSELKGGGGVLAYRSNNSTTTPDNAAGTGTLDSGVWSDAQELPFSETNVISYTGTPRNGGVYTDDLGGSPSGGGPSGDTKITGSIIGLKGIFRAKRGTGSGTTHGLVVGNSSESIGSLVNQPSLTTSYAPYFHINNASAPSSSQTILIGMRVNGSQDIFVSDMLGQILHIPASDPISSVDGVSWANISSIDGVAKANIANLSGVAA